MTIKGLRVLKGYIELSSSERDELKQEIDKYDKSFQKSIMTEEIERQIRKSVLVPVTNVCPCCGR
jgi:hypothetical protein